jgi:3-hydroxyisobutyrate dehydrogenase-like beta-hydroxyacid dehydrogenase
LATHVAVVGLGRMGQAVAGRLLSQGLRVTVFNRSPGKSTELQDQGAKVAATAREAAQTAQVVLSVLTDEAAVQEMCSGPVGLLAGLRGRSHLSISTLAPDAAARLDALHVAAGARYISTPVQGRPAMARSGQLIAWVSGFDLDAPARHALDTIARQTYRLGGDVRNAAAAKLALNMLMNANIELFAEAFSYLASRGVDTRAFGNALTETAFAAPLFKAIVAALGSDDDKAGGSDVSVSRKDLDLLVNDLPGQALPVTRKLAEVFDVAQARGWGHLDPIAVRRLFMAGSA